MNERHARWHQLTPEAVCQQLHTDAACGLSRRAARSRCKKQGINTLFDPQTGQWKRWLRLLFCDPAILLMLFATLLTAFLTNPLQGISVFVLLLFGGIMLVRVLLRYHHFEQTASRYRIPTVHVLREGRLLAVSARRVARGDVLLLRKGDVVPGDCRLLRAQGLRVMTRILNENGQATYRSFFKNADTVYPYGAEISAPMQENMLFGGSEILEGEACAVVVELGEASYLGAVKHLMPADDDNARWKNDSLGSLRNLLRIYGFLMPVLLFLLTVIGLLTQPQERGLMDVFLPLCILCASASPALLEIFLEWIRLRGRIALLRKDGEADPAVLNSGKVMDRLSDMTDLLVVGKRGLSDGIRHFDSAFAAQREIRPTNDAPTEHALASLCEALLLREEELARALSTEALQRAEEDAVFLSELCRVAAFDRAAMRVRLLEIQRQPSFDSIKAEAFSVRMREEAFTLFFEEDGTHLLEACTVWDDEKRLCAISPEQRTRLRAYHSEMRARACRTVIVARQYGNALALIGVVAMRERYCIDAERVINSFSCCGVRVTVALRAEDCADACGLWDDRLYRGETEPPIDTVQMLRHRVWIGFSPKELAVAVREMQKQGRRVAVLGGHAEDVAFLTAHSLTIVCDPIGIPDDQDEERAVERWQADGEEEGQMAAQNVKRHADAVVQRADGKSGGIHAVLHALLESRATKLRMQRMLRFLISSQLLQIALTVLCACFGIGFFNGVQAVLFCLLSEVGALVLLAKLPVSQVRLHRAPAVHADFLLRVLKNLQTLLPCLIPPAIGVIYGFILLQTGIASQEQTAAYLFVSAALVQVILLVRELCVTKERLPWREFLLLVLVTLLSVGVAILLSCLHSVADRIFGLGNWTLLTALSVAVMPSAFALTKIFTAIFQRTTK